MIANDELPQMVDGFFAYEADPRCVGCGRSLIARFGGAPSTECPSCKAEFELLNRAGKVTLVLVA